MIHFFFSKLWLIHFRSVTFSTFRFLSTPVREHWVGGADSDTVDSDWVLYVLFYARFLMFFIKVYKHFLCFFLNLQVNMGLKKKEVKTFITTGAKHFHESTVWSKLQWLSITGINETILQCPLNRRERFNSRRCAVFLAQIKSTYCQLLATSGGPAFSTSLLQQVPVNFLRHKSAILR